MIKGVALLKRPEGMTREEFKEWWLGPHAELGKRLPKLRKYTISMVVGPSPWDEDPAEPAYDGIAEIWFDTKEDLISAWTETPEGRSAVEDALTHNSTRLNLVTEENVMFDTLTR